MKVAAPEATTLEVSDQDGYFKVDIRTTTTSSSKWCKVISAMKISDLASGVD
jgi:hypothetical protein